MRCKYKRCQGKTVNDKPFCPTHWKVLPKLNRDSYFSGGVSEQQWLTEARRKLHILETQFDLDDWPFFKAPGVWPRKQ